MKPLTTLSLTVLASTATAFFCPPGKIGECCIAPYKTNHICMFSLPFPSHSLNFIPQNLGTDKREGEKATIKPSGPPLPNYQCIFIDDIARESLCCVVVSYFIDEREEATVVDQCRLMGSRRSAVSLLYCVVEGRGRKWRGDGLESARKKEWIISTRYWLKENSVL